MGSSGNAAPRGRPWPLSYHSRWILQQALFPQAHEAAPGHHQVVVEVDAHDLRRFAHGPGEAYVVLTGREVPAGVVMHQDEPQGMMHDGRLQDLPGMSACGVEGGQGCRLQE